MTSPTSVSRGRPRPKTQVWWVVAGATGVAGLAAVLWASRWSPPAGALAALGVSGVASSATGVVIITLAVGRRRAGIAGEPVRLLLGLAALVWGVGQCVVTLEAGADGVRVLGVGDLFGPLAAVLVVLGLSSLPRRSQVCLPSIRLGLDVALLALSVTAAVWWVVMSPLVPVSQRGGSDAVSIAGAVLLDVVTAALPLLVWVRDRRPGAAHLAAGVALHAAADVSTFPSLLEGRLVPWQSGVIWSIAWPIIGIGLVRLKIVGEREERDDVPDNLGETRSTTMATVLSFGTLAVAFGMPIPYRWVGIGGVLQLLVAVVAVTRELMVGRIRARLIRRLAEDASRDVLTGLPNRRALIARIRGLDLSRPWVLLVVDLDDFKEVNDLLGPEAGDGLLTEIALLMAGLGPPSGLVARIGGDEFAVLAPGGLPEGELLADRLGSAIRAVPTARTGGMPLSASIGIGPVQLEAQAPAPRSRAPGPEPRHDRLAALTQSAAAVRAAKAAGRGRVAVYPGAVEQARQRRLVLERRLREALVTGRLRMHAQPLVDLASGQVRGFESLARWTDDLLGPVAPSEFVPVAEQSGLVTSLGEFALRSTLEQVRSCGLLHRDVEIGVNVSPIQLRQPQFAARVSDLVAELDLPPRRLLLEVTEAILVDEDDPAAGTLAELAAAGIRLAIDDFGTGYSALGYLRRLPLDVLKIDRSWVVDAVSDRRTRYIVLGVVELAHQLGVTVVMEGVEDAGVAGMCRDLGADVGQGWFFGRPSPWPDAATRLDLPVSRD